MIGHLCAFIISESLRESALRRSDYVNGASHHPHHIRRLCVVAEYTLAHNASRLASRPYKRYTAHLQNVCACACILYTKYYMDCSTYAHSRTSQNARGHCKRRDQLRFRSYDIEQALHHHTHMFERTRTHIEERVPRAFSTVSRRTNARTRSHVCLACAFACV